MPTYRYEAVDSSGAHVSGEVEASNESAAAQDIKSRGMFLKKLVLSQAQSSANQSQLPQSSGPHPAGNPGLEGLRERQDARDRGEEWTANAARTRDREAEARAAAAASRLGGVLSSATGSVYETMTPTPVRAEGEAPQNPAMTFQDAMAGSRRRGGDGGGPTPSGAGGGGGGGGGGGLPGGGFGGLLPAGPGGPGPNADTQWYQDSANLTNRLLTEIRDDIREMNGGYGQGRGAGGGAGWDRAADEKSYFTKAGSFEDLLSVLSEKSAGASQSGSNLAGLARGMIGMVRRRLKGFGGQKAGTILGGHGVAFVGGRGDREGNRGDGSWYGGVGRRAAGKKKKRSLLDRILGRKAYQGPDADSWAKGASGEAFGAGAAFKGATAMASRALGTFAAATVEAGKAVYAFARQQEQEIRRLAEVGGSQAAAIAILDVDRTIRDINTARETAGSSTELTESLSRFEEALRPIEVLMTNLANTVGSGLLDLLSGGVELLGDLAEGLDEIANTLGLWESEEKKRKLKPLPFEQIKNIVANQEKVDRPQWPGAGGDASTISSPFQGEPWR